MGCAWCKLYGSGLASLAMAATLVGAEVQSDSQCEFPGGKIHPFPREAPIDAFFFEPLLLRSWRYSRPSLDPYAWTWRLPKDPDNGADGDGLCGVQQALQCVLQGVRIGQFAVG